MTILNIAIIGLGNRSLKRALKTVANDPDHWNLVAACDTSHDARERFATALESLNHQTVPAFRDVPQLLSWHQDTKTKTVQPTVHCVYVALPHHRYIDVLPQLLEAGFHVIKEKPAAMSVAELQLFQRAASAKSMKLVTASQRRYGSKLAQIKQWIPFLGPIHTIEATRKIAVPNLAEGWRASNALAGGGAMGDIGWHLLDQILGLFGQTTNPRIAYCNLFHIRGFQGHDCEDSAEVILNLDKAGPKAQLQQISAHLMVSRIGHTEVDDLIITGEDGVLTSVGDEITLQMFCASGERIFLSTGKERGLTSDFSDMFSAFHAEVLQSLPSKTYSQNQFQDLAVTRLLGEIYAKAKEHVPSSVSRLTFAPRGDTSVRTTLKDHAVQMEWPIIDADVEIAVNKQLHDDISIYGNGGVFKTFENEFKAAHNMSDGFALLHNSGTNALHALYFAARFCPGDEVIFPVYTFHATCSPAMHFGIKPIFCDSGEDGNISPIAIAKALSPKTKAVIVTHMWGVPCDMTAIHHAISGRKDVLLFEDCSHAHGATLNGQPLGTFGDGAVWSLQGQKIVSGGEGGIAMTKHAEFHYRQLIWGHYNKRCKLEIPADHPLGAFSLTGAGLKSRAHPLAVSIALNQLRKLDGFHTYKMRYAQQLIKALSHIPFLELPVFAQFDEPSWYAFVMRFKASKAPPGLTRETFVAALHSHGLVEVDIPGSTGLLAKEPLFNRPEVLFPHLYAAGSLHSGDQGSFNVAQKFFEEAIKLPVYANENGQAATDRYVEVIKEVANQWMKSTRVSKL